LSAVVASSRILYFYLLTGLDSFGGKAAHKKGFRRINLNELNPKKIIIVHGENSRCLDLASSLHKMQRVETIAPKNLEAIRIR